MAQQQRTVCWSSTVAWTWGISSNIDGRYRQPEIKPQQQLKPAPAPAPAPASMLAQPNPLKTSPTKPLHAEQKVPDEKKPIKPLETPPPPPTKAPLTGKGEQVGVVQKQPQEEKTYATVTGKEETTDNNLQLWIELKLDNGKTMEFKGEATGIFTPSCSILQRARLRTRDLEALEARGTLFYFDFRPNRFELRFYDPDNRQTPLAILYADAIQCAANPGFAKGNWSTDF